MRKNKMTHGLEDFFFENCPDRYFDCLNEYHQCKFDVSTPSQEAPCLFEGVDYRRCPIYDSHQEQSNSKF